MDPNEGSTLYDVAAAIQAALAKLQRLGQSDIADAAIADARAKSNYADLDADTTRNDDYKRKTYASRYVNVMTTLARKLTAAANSAAASDQDDAARVFGIKGLPGDVASLAISRRDAGDRVAMENDTIQLQRLLATAVRAGDDVLAHAIAEQAITTGDADTANAFAAAYPNLAPAVERLWTAEHRKTNTLDVVNAWSVAALKPAAISNLQDYEIQRVASGETNVGKWSAGR